MGYDKFLSEVTTIVRLSLNPPEIGGMGRGSEAERKLVDEWRAELSARWGAALTEARRGNPEITRLLELVGAEAGFYDPDGGRRSRVIPAPGGWAVTVVSEGVER